MPPISTNNEKYYVKGILDKKLIVYFTNWSIYGRNFQVKDIPVKYITDINYAFFDLRQNSRGNYVPTSGDTWADNEQRYTTTEKGLEPLDSWNTTSEYYGNFGQLRKLKEKNPDISIGLSLGGWSWSKYFSPAVSTEETRLDFVKEIINIFKKYSFFTRVDIDWEYISPTKVSYGDPGNISNEMDAKNFGLFLKLLRETITSEGFNNYEITACTTADPKKMEALPINDMVKYLDNINIMTYDFADGNWGVNRATHQTNLYKTAYTLFSIEESVNKMISLGVPTDKIVIGGALYSRGFSNTEGIAKPCNGGSTDKSWENGIVDYKALPLPGATEMYDEQAGAGYSYDPVKKIVNSYDTKRSIEEKAEYIKRLGLKGIILWEISGDNSKEEKSLVKVIHDSYNGPPKIPLPVFTPKPQPVKLPPPIKIPEPKPTPTPPVPVVNPKCPYLNNKIKTVTITGQVSIEHIKFNTN